MSLSHVAEDSALRNEDDATGYRAETTWLRLMPQALGLTILPTVLLRADQVIACPEKGRRD